MHKDKLKVRLCANTGCDVKELLEEFAYQLNGINQWKIEPVPSGKANFEITLWKATGLSHVNTEDKLQSWAKSTSSIDTVEVIDSWSNI